jgi:class 3 adenylate cyclase
MRDFMEERLKERKPKGEICFEIRIGVNSGPVIAGVVGIKKFVYDIWGDTVNMAARMQQNSEPGKVNISDKTKSLVKDKFTFEHRGKLLAHHKGEIDMFFVEELNSVFETV